MKLLQVVLQRWSRLSITTKFSLAFGLLLTLILIIAVSSYVMLSMIRDKIETSILTSIQIQRIVLEMDSGLEKARRLQRDFFLRYPQIGYTEARNIYAHQALDQIDEVVVLSKQLRHLIERTYVSDALQNSNVNLNLYLSAAERYSATFQEAVDLVTSLADENVGAQTQLSTNSETLHADLEQTANARWIDLNREMQLYEKNYLITRRRSYMQSAFNIAIELRQSIQSSEDLPSESKGRILSEIDSYQILGEKIVDLDASIHSRYNDFDLQAQSIDPISAELIALATAEVDRAHTQIKQTSRYATYVLLAITLVGLSLALLIAFAFNYSITRNVIRLTRIASLLQSGNLTVFANIDSEDEIGNLARTFNSMAAQLKTSFTSLQNSEVRYRTLFEDSPISLWEEDFSEVKKYLESIPQEDISNWESYLTTHPQVVKDCISLVKIIGVNRATLDMLKFENKLDLMENLALVFTPDSYDQFANELFWLMQGKTAYDMEIAHQTSSGEELIIDLRLNIVPGYEGTWSKVLVSLVDVIERKRAEGEIRKLNAELEQRVIERTAQLEVSNKELEAFAYSVSHDLRAPLRSMDGFSQAILEDYGSCLDARGQNYLMRIRSSSQHMSQLIDALLKLSRVTRSEMLVSPVNLSDLVGRSIWG
jgi:signal transduction histidine kinase